MNNVLNFRRSKLEIDSDMSGKSVLELVQDCFSKGEKSLAFGSTQYKNSQEKCIALVGDFLTKKIPTLTVLIITFDLNRGVFSDFIKESKIKNNYLYQFDENLYFMDWAFVNRSEIRPKDLVDSYDMVLWDLPDLNIISQKHSELHESFENMDALFIISLQNSKFDEEHFKREIFRFYQDHGLDIRGILPWKIASKRRTPRSIWSRFFYGLFRR